MNFYDSGRTADLLSPLGYEIIASPNDADISILNTCHIREKAEQKMYSDLGRLLIHKNKRKEDGQDMIIAVGGCVGQAEGAEIIKQAPYVSMVFGPQTYHRLPEMIAQLHRKEDQINEPQKRGIIDTEFPLETKFDHLPTPTATTASAFVSIQEGCDKFCHFCVVPYTRGAEYSRPVSLIIDEIKHLVDQGVKEITLLGQNVNAYHGQAPAVSSCGEKEWDLGHLIFEIAKIKEIQRIRYTTSHPLDMHQSLYEAHRDVDALMPFLHLPVQSGSDTILSAMNRKHTQKEYLQIIEKLRFYQPQMAFSSDFIVGYPNESDADFKATLNLIQEVGYAQAYSFKYSPRPGTPASVMDAQVPEALKDERLQALQGLLCAYQLKFNKTFEGKIVPILFEKAGKKENQMLGKSPYLQSVHVLDGGAHLVKNIVPVRIVEAFQNSLRADIVTHQHNVPYLEGARGCAAS